MPALLTKMSRPVLLVALRTASAASAIDSGDVTLSGMVAMPRSARWAILAGLRAVAKTVRPRGWNSRASASPMPPSLQPVAAACDED